MVIGSGHMFSDKYLDKENNDKFRELTFRFLLSNEKLNIISTDHDDIDVSFTNSYFDQFNIDYCRF